MPRGGKERTEDKEKGDRAGNAVGESKEKNDDRKKPRKYGNNQYGGNRNNRDNGRFYGKNRYHGGGGNRRPYSKRARFDVGERLKEVDLGITEYMGDVDGFTGTIKERYNDFIVHEIDFNGDIAKLTNQDIPPEPEEMEDIQELQKKIPEDVYEKLKTIADDPSVEIDVTDMDKEQRKCIHKVVKVLTSVFSETKDIENRKVIVFSKEYTNKFGFRVDNRKDWSIRGGDYCHFVLHKSNIDTMDALNQLSRMLHVKTSIFNYAGTKDRRAKTTQWVSVKKMNPKNIMNAARGVRGTYVGNFKFEKEPLKLGKLYGNRFTIALRNVSAPDELIEKAMVSLRDNGFINYYGLQRFGTIASIPTYEIGKALLQGNWAEAVDLILKPREGEQDFNLSEARECYKNTKDSRLAYVKIGRTDRLEAKLLWGINICGQKNLQGALEMVPRNTMLMYVHAYQSLAWNLMVSRRIKEFGFKPVVGDLVYENPNSLDEHVHHEEPQHERIPDEDGKPTSDESTAAKEEKTDNLKTEGADKSSETSIGEKNDEPKVEDDKLSEKSDGERQLPKVKILTEEDLSKYKITDIIMPQPGWKVTYPSYAKAWYDEYLEKDGLTSDLKQKNKKFSLSGSYRKIAQVPEDLKWKVIRYSNKTEDLIVSDLEEMKDKEPPQDNPEGSFKALIIEMSLKSSSYATMALREVLKFDTSSQTHAAQSAAFQDAHEKNEESAGKDKKGSGSEVEENVPGVKNLKIGDRNGDEAGQSTEDEAGEKKTNVSTASSMMDESMMEEDAKKSKASSSMLEESIKEGRTEVDDKLKIETKKHEVDVINDSGIEPEAMTNTA